MERDDAKEKLQGVAKSIISTFEALSSGLLLEDFDTPPLIHLEIATTKRHFPKPKKERMKAFQNRLALASLTATALMGTSHAFAPPLTTPALPTTTISRPMTALSALPVDQLADAATTALSSWDEIMQQSASHLLLADDATAAAGEATGWWGAYINVFKSTLLFVHGTIDAPLRSVGFDQTWGVSIGLFTLSKCLCCFCMDVHMMVKEQAV